MCGVYDDQFSGQVSYRVTADSLGCWTATRTGNPGEGSRKKLSGCVDLFDHILTSRGS